MKIFDWPCPPDFTKLCLRPITCFLAGAVSRMTTRKQCEVVPTVALFGPTRDDETSQWMNPKSIIVKKNLDCQPCMQRACPLKHHDCMKLIKAEDVLKAVQSLN